MIKCYALNAYKLRIIGKKINNHQEIERIASFMEYYGG